MKDKIREVRDVALPYHPHCLNDRGGPHVALQPWLGLLPQWNLEFGPAHRVDCGAPAWRLSAGDREAGHINVHINVKEIAKVESPFVKESHMKQWLVAIVLLSSVVLFGCSSNLGRAGLGAVGGAAAGAAGYEYNAHRQLQQLEEDYKSGRIDRKEYAVRKEQIQKSSILK
jgi:hypothetical protein